METTIAAPSPAEFSLAMCAMFETAGAIVSIQARKRGVPVLGDRARDLASELEESFAKNADAYCPSADEMSEVTLTAFYEEMLYVVSKYRRSIEEMDEELRAELPEYVVHFADVPTADPTTRDAADDASVVLNSVKELLDKLPKRLKRAIEVILEFLKLTSGG